MGMDPVVTRQESAIRVEDDGNEAGSTFGTVNTAYSRDVDEKFRHRFLIQETGGGGKNNARPMIEFRKNGGTWTPVPNVDGGEAIVVLASTYYTDGDDTTERIGGAEAFQSPNSGMNDADNISATFTFPGGIGGSEAEWEWCLKIPAANVNNDDTVELRTVENGTPWIEYNSASIFEITVIKGAPPARRRPMVVT